MHSPRHVLPIALCSLCLALVGCLDRPVAPQQPITSRVSTKVVTTQKIEKVDLLFMIDNSISMTDKQEILRDAVPDLLTRLTKPDCVNAQTGARQQPTNDICPDGSALEFDPPKDMHIGILSSSLELPDSANCKSAADHGLVTRGIISEPFLTWTPDNAADTLTKFQQMVSAVGEEGCGYEASLESWYRFLVDPAPPAGWKAAPCNDGDTQNACRFPDGVDDTILGQRKAFLRDDSLLAIVMLTDENDCSMDPTWQGWFGGADTGSLGRGTNACLVDWRSPDCVPCGALGIDPEKYPECSTPIDSSLADDPRHNLRCWEPRKRFGFSFLHPLARYVSALTEAHLNGQWNPLFCSQPSATDPTACADTPRRKEMIFLAGIVGVPWQDLANDPTDLTSGYRPATQFSWTRADFTGQGLEPPKALTGDSSTLWQVVLGKTTADHEIDPTVAPSDPLMIEDVLPRTGSNPSLDAPLADPGSSSPTANPVNGHEWNASVEYQLQYACIFKKKTDEVCTDTNCDCYNFDGEQSPLCQSDSGDYDNVQRRAKAFPATRQLAVLEGVGDQAIVASICPSTLDSASSAFGYRPAMAALVDRLSSALAGTCWEEPLKAEDDGSVPCVVLEATRGVDLGNGKYECPACDGVRTDPKASAYAGVRDKAEYSGMHCLCEVQQVPAEGGALQSCVRDTSPESSVKRLVLPRPERRRFGQRHRSGALQQDDPIRGRCGS